MRVFVSAVTSELGSVRDRLASALASRGSRFDPTTRDSAGLDVYDQRSLPQETYLLPKLERAVDVCEVVVALVGTAYGAEPSPGSQGRGLPRRSFTQWEYHFALGERLDGSTVPRKHVLVYISKPSPNGAPERREPEELHALQRAFVDAVKRSGVEYYEFADADDLVQRVLVDLGAYLGRRDRERAAPSLEYPPDRFDVGGPPSGPLRAAASVARYETREPSARRLADRLRAPPRAEPRSVIIVEGTLGWGKDTLIARTLASAGLPTLWVDLAHVPAHSGVVDAVFGGVRGLTDGDERSLERNPASVSRFVAETVPPDTVVVFANAQWNDRRRVDATVRAVAADLARRGHWVFVEVWSALRDQLAFEPSARAEVLPALPRLLDSEVLSWASARVGRELRRDEQEALALFDGHPLLVRVALELLAEPRVVGGGRVDVEDVALVLEDHWERIRGFAEEEGVAGGALDPRLAVWFGLLPWASCAEEELVGLDPDELDALRRLGLLVAEPGVRRWRPAGWARVFGLWAGRGQPLRLPEEAARWLRSIAGSVAPENAWAQRRHLAERRKHVPEGLDALIEDLLVRVPIPADPVQEVVPGYDPPAPPVELKGTDDAVALDILLWAFEGAARRGDSTAFTEAEEVLRRSRDRVRDFLRTRWSAVKSLHTALLRAPVSPARRRELYATWTAVLPRDAEAAAVRAWSARLLAEAASSARDAGWPEVGALIADARAVIATLDVAPGDAYARSLNQDTRYIAAEAAIGGRTSAKDLVQAHREALDSIPPEGDWVRERATVWLLRSLRHLEFVVSHASDGDVELLRLRAMLLRLPIGLEWANAFERLRSGKHWLPDAAARMLTNVLRARQDEAVRSDADSMLVRILRHLDDERVPTPEASVAAVRDACARLGGPSTEEACALLKFGLVALRRRSRRDTGPETRAYRVCREALTWALEHGAEWAHSRWLEGMRREALRYVASHELASVRSGEAGPDEQDGDATRTAWAISLRSRRDEDVALRSEVDRFERAARRILRAYDTHVATGADPWLWVDAIERRISLVRARYRMFRAADERRERAALEGALQLDAVVRECDASAVPPEVKDSVAVRVHRYLWQRPQFLERFRALVERPLDLRRRVEVARIGVSALMPLVFEPPVVAHPDATVVDAAECKRLLLLCLHDLATVLARPAPRRLYKSVSRCMDARGDPSLWRDVMLPVFEGVGGRDDYFATVLRRAEEASLAEREGRVPATEVSERELLDDLTDARMLDVAARLARFGCGDEQLPVDLRRRLGDAAVVLAADAALWRSSRSRSGRSGFVAQWHEGVSIGVALLQSPDGTVGGRTHSYLARRDGSRLSWFDAAFSRIGSAEQASVGAFRSYVRVAAQRLREALHKHRGALARGEGEGPS